MIPAALSRASSSSSAHSFSKLPCSPSAGGGKGAAIGAILGAGVGAGSVFVQDGKDLILEPGTEILIRSAAPARTRD